MFLHAGRVALLIAREMRKPRVGLADEVRVQGRAWPWYCDANLHVNNAEYARLMEYGRWAWIVRTGIWRRVRSEGSRVVVAGSSQTFRREVRIFGVFQVRTKLCGLDERSAVFEQSVWMGAKLACHSYQRMMVVGRDGIRPPSLLADEGVPQLEGSAVRSWLESQSAILAREKSGTLDGEAPSPSAAVSNAGLSN
jgi:acyl-CoA thioesterase FadM